MCVEKRAATNINKINFILW